MYAFLKTCAGIMHGLIDTVKLCSFSMIAPFTMGMVCHAQPVPDDYGVLIFQPTHFRGERGSVMLTLPYEGNMWMTGTMTVLCNEH
jgi:hypothetical protein